MATSLPHLGDSINTATRPQHIKLNKSILLRLPLSVPPRACNPTPYLTGLLHIAPIYIAFESAWDNILASHENLEKTTASTLLLSDATQGLPLFPFGTADPTTTSDGKGERICTVLRELKIEGMARSESIKADIRAMSGWSEEELEEQLEVVRGRGRLGEFVRHVYGNIGKQPEVVIAYAWVLYMALFSGGRFLASCLEAAGEGFWGRGCDEVLGRGCREPVRVKDDGLPLRFFRFATPLEGEEIKTEFKTRLLELEGLLTGGERDHVVREGVCIFDVMLGIVGQLDQLFDNEGVVGDGDGGMSPGGSLDGWASMLVPRVAVGRLRDSVAVAKERGLRTLRKATFSGSSPPPSLIGEGVARRRRRSSGSMESLNTSSSPATAETSTSGLHAHGTITSAMELVEKTSVGKMKSPALEQDPGVKVVRFGVENAVIQQGRKGAKSVTVRTEAVQEDGEWGRQPVKIKGECPLTRVRRRTEGRRVSERGREEVKNSSTFWSLVLLVALVGFGWGYGYGYITGR
ncbi:hypothetical protein QBC40DRAFT_194553 [Triangularia verruculosa]|uniref:Heme oxygenase-like protein n=1 Tax=Triangularia verruculosa TaxID=2587418 RepID=A0AAN6XMB5_9PEZI|nr:hypothetical protein QBC40DRAFT_194553 [Triangularia verruculosa]